MLIATFVNSLLILCCLVFSIVLTLSTIKAGTFSIFGKSWYYYQSDVMTGEVEKNELLMINHKTSDLQPDDLVAFYQTDAKGNRVIQIARLQQIDGNQYLVSEADGDPFILDSTSTVLIGQVTGHSKFLGKIVQQMRTSEGRKIFLGWSVAIALFACGLTILLHVRRERKIQLEGGNEIYDDYDEYEEYDNSYDDYDDQYDSYDPYEEEEYDDDYPEEPVDSSPADRFNRVTVPDSSFYTPSPRSQDDSPAYEEAEPEIPQAVDENNMNLIAASTESEEEEDVDFDVLFRQINRQLKKQ